MQALPAIGSLASGTAAAGAGGTAAESSFGASALSTGANVGGGLFGAFGGFQQGQYQAAVAARNERYAQDSANQSLLSGQQAEQQTKLQFGAIGAEATASAAARGLDVASGTPAAVQQSISSVGAMDEATQHYNTLRQAYGYDVQAANFAAQEANAKRGATGALLGGLFGAAGSFISGASSLNAAVQSNIASGAVS